MNIGNIRKLVQTTTFPALGLLLLTIAGCTKDETIPVLSGSQPVHFELSVANKTRMQTSLVGYYSAFEEGDAVGLFAVYDAQGNPGSPASSDNILHNRKLVFNGTSWIPEGEPFYMPSTGKIDFYAYFPYDSLFTDPTDLIFTVSTDQSTQADFSRSDLMTACKVGVSANSNRVALTFYHRLALLELKLETGNAPQATPFILQDIDMNGVRFDLKRLAINNTMTTVTNDKKIKVYRPADDVAWVLLPPETYNDLTFRLDNNMYRISEPLILSSGNVTSYNVKLK